MCTTGYPSDVRYNLPLDRDSNRNMLLRQLAREARQYMTFAFPHYWHAPP